MAQINPNHDIAYVRKKILHGIRTKDSLARYGSMFDIVRGCKYHARAMYVHGILSNLRNFALSTFFHNDF